MPDTQAPSTELTSQYIAQVTSDLERNAKEQERISTEIEALQEQLRALQHDHTVLVTMQQALSAGNIAAAESAAQLDIRATPTVPHQATAAEAKPGKSAPKQSKAKKAVSASTRKTAARKPATKATTATKSTAATAATAAKKTDSAAKPASATKTSSAAKPAAKQAAKPTAKSAASAPEKTDKGAAKPTLVELIRGHLEEQKEPRSAAEVTSALTQAHPDRSIKTTVVRTTLEGLVAKSHAHRSKQGSSVFYTATTTSEPAKDDAQQEPAAG
ncbi:BlaI/MecI/CopY family transcriptional regulator [Streptomyces sp. NPDC005907]|uniref:BlaI/MecI/CopY family transcriptional regulator n=1 Tax=Streptomyces sp. NPDC005907 TaxID=3154571 RepID=UPI0033E57D55